ncbi:hypothetical protein F4777DRAFT_539926 [Nemania sp. FL0916]|nr:hypothetical protein F4777DRAFT_539926 [Nemania sp. FL0916]
MPQDPNLYGQRPAKKQKKEIPLSSSLAFTSQLSALISTPTATSSSSATASGISTGRSRPSKTKPDLFSSSSKGKRKQRDGGAEEKEKPDNGPSSKIRIKHVHGTEEEKQDFARARRKMEEKARLYAAMKRGDYVARENESAPLVDFDRKWAERHPEDDAAHARESSSGSDNESSDNDDDRKEEEEMVEYQDEFGRTRTGTRAEVRQQQRREARAALGASELAAMAAIPTAAPRNLIFGDAIQTAAFNPEASTRDAMASLAARRDRTPTPPPDTHFDGRAEIRTKGAGFFHFDRDEAVRKQQMDDLAKERENTERVRRERADEKERRRREIEERRLKIGKRRAEKMASNFLDGLAGEMMASAGATGADNGVGQAEKDMRESEGESREVKAMPTNAGVDKSDETSS